MSSLSRTYARRIQRAGYQSRRRVRPQPALVVKPFQRDVLRAIVEHFVEAKENAA